MPMVTVIQPTLVESKAKIRAAAYCRVSSSSEDQLNSYMAQVTYYSHKFEDSETEILVDVYADEGITSTREDKRDEFQRLMQDCRRGKIGQLFLKSSTVYGIMRMIWSICCPGRMTIQIL